MSVIMKIIDKREGCDASWAVIWWSISEEQLRW